MKTGLERPARVCLMHITPETLVALMRGQTFRVVDNGLPDDARVLFAELRQEILHLAITSAWFDEVRPDEHIPLLPPAVFEIVDRPKGATH